MQGEKGKTAGRLLESSRGEMMVAQTRVLAAEMLRAVGSRYGEFYPVGCWIFLYSYRHFWALFWNAVMLCGNSLVLSDLIFTFFLWSTRTAFNLGLIFPHFWGKILLRYLNDALRPFRNEWEHHYEVFCSCCWRKAWFLPLRGLCAHFPLIFKGSSLPGLGSFLTCMCW